MYQHCQWKKKTRPLLFLDVTHRGMALTNVSGQPIRPIFKVN